MTSQGREIVFLCVIAVLLSVAVTAVLALLLYGIGP